MSEYRRPYNQDGTITEQMTQFFDIYQLLRVKKKDELGFSKKTRIELKKKFMKLSHVGLKQVQSDFKMDSMKSTNFNLSPRHYKALQNTRLMHKEQFRLFFGLLGQGSNPFLSDRIFKLADQDRDMHITFEEFATIMDIYQNGSVEEKNEFSFSLFDENQDGLISLEDMYVVMKKFMSHWSTLQGSATVVDKKALQRIFDQIDVNGDGDISLSEYKNVLRTNPGLFEWFNILNNISNIEISQEMSKDEESKSNISSAPQSIKQKLETVEKQRQDEKIETQKEILKFYMSI